MQEIDFKRFMFEQKIKQNELAEYLGVSKGYMSLVISGQRKLSEENFSKLINNPFGWDTSILLGVEKENSENQPENPVEEQPQDRTMLDRLFAIVESQKDDINTLIQLVKEKDSKIEELIDELNAYKYKGETAHTVGDSSSADAV